jgi:hypothetical protein
MAAAAAGKPTTRVAGTVGALLSGSKGGAGGVADQYLGLQFGLMPVLRDLFSLMTLREDLERKIRWLRSHNKKSVRRRVELDSASFSEAVASVGTQSASMGPVLATQLYANPSGPTGFQVTKSVSYRIWFEAKYRYYIPEVAFKDPLTKPFGLAADLAGLSPDPVVIYKVIPWSWLLDWFTSVGSVIQNIMLRHKYHVVAEYAYVMASQDITYEKPGYCVTKSGTYTCTPQGCSFTGPDVVHAGSAKTVYAIRQRAVANPYGFGITWSALTPYQLSILAALGLSKGGKSLP